MNSKIFNKLLKQADLKQHRPEWKTFLEFCSMYLKAHGIKNPLVVELNAGKENQKEYWTELFNAKCININMAGKSSDHKTLINLKREFGKQKIDILFIDASHTYQDVKRDYEFYSPLCSGLVVFQGIETFRGTGRKSAQVWKFWDELKAETHKGVIAIFHRRTRGCQRGIGIIVK